MTTTATTPATVSILGTRITPPPIAPRLLRPKDAATALGVSDDTVYRLIQRGELRSVRVGADRRVPVAAIDEYVARLEREGGNGNGRDYGTASVHGVGRRADRAAGQPRSVRPRGAVALPVNQPRAHRHPRPDGAA